MKISRMSGSAIRKATVDLRCISLCRLDRLLPARTAEFGAAISAMTCSVLFFLCRCFGYGEDAASQTAPPHYAAACLVAHEAFALARRPIERLLECFALEVAHGHLRL